MLLIALARKEPNFRSNSIKKRIRTEVTFGGMWEKISDSAKSEHTTFGGMWQISGDSAKFFSSNLAESGRKFD